MSGWTIDPSSRINGYKRRTAVKSYKLSPLAEDRFRELAVLLDRVTPGRKVGADAALLFACQCARTRLLATYKRLGLDPEAVLAEARKDKAPAPMPDLSKPRPVVDE